MTVRFVEVFANGQRARALVDTGASVSLISSRMANGTVQVDNTGELSGLGGSIRAKGTTVVNIRAGPVSVNALFYVVDSEVTHPYDLYLGVNILEDNNWTIDMGKGWLDVGGYVLPITKARHLEATPLNGLRQLEQLDDEYRGEDDDICYDFNFDEVVGNEEDEWYTDEDGPRVDEFPAIEWHKEETEGEALGERREQEQAKNDLQKGNESEDKSNNNGVLVFTEEERESFTKDILEEFEEVFGEIPLVPSDKIKPYEIRLKPGAGPIRAKVYRLSPQYEPFVKKQIQDLLEKQIIRPSTSEYCSPLWVVPKRGENGQQDYRLVVDFRKINSITEFENYPLPRIDEILDQLGRARCFSVADLKAGYHQVPIHKDDICKTAFTVFGKHYEFVKLAFGLQTAAQNFQKIMNEVLDELVGTACFVYLDDIIIHGRTRQEHDENLRKVLTRLKEYKLRVKPSKCQFLTNEIDFLGHRITPRGVGMSVEKINALRSLKVPNTVKRLRSFLGLANYYRKFIANYATIASPLYKLLKKDVKFKWNQECQEAFEKLIRGVNEDAALAFPDYEKQFHLTTDASKVGIGAVLSQEDEKGQQRPISFISRKLNQAESNYSTTEQEYLAIVWAIGQLRHYLVGKQFIVYTDHKSLLYLKDQWNVSPRLHRWITRLQEFSFVLRYKPGKENYVADELSRNFEDDVPVVEEEVAPREAFEDIVEHIANLFQVQHVEVGVEDEQGPENSEDEDDDDELADRQQSRNVEKITDKDKIRNIILEFHAGRWAGHRGERATESAIRFYFSFPKMRERIKEIVSRCDQCQKAKHSRVNRSLPMAISSTCVKPNEKIAYDVIGPFRTACNGKLYGLTIQDDFSKFTKFCALEDCSAKEVARALVEEWILCYGLPRELVSDNGRNLVGEVMGEIARYFGIARILTALGHPQANGAVEKTHQRLSEFIRATDEDLEKDAHWAMRLKLASYAFNTTRHSSTHYSPHQLMFGQAPRLISAIHTDKPFATPNSYIRELQLVQNELWAKARENIIAVKEKQAERDIKTKPKRQIETYVVGQKVLVKAETLQGKANRMEPVWKGPFEIAQVGEHSVLIKKRNRLCRISFADVKPYIE